MIFKCGKKKKGRRFLLLAVFLVVVFMASSALALYDSPNKELLTYVCTNSSGVYTNTNISTSTITTQNHRILGFSMAAYDTSKSTEWVVGLYDCDTDGEITDTYIFDEAEFGTTDNKAPRWYAYPKRLTQGLTVQQGPNTTVTIYYEDTRKF